MSDLQDEARILISQRPEHWPWKEKKASDWWWLPASRFLFARFLPLFWVVDFAGFK